MLSLPVTVGCCHEFNELLLNVLAEGFVSEISRGDKTVIDLFYRLGPVLGSRFGATVG